MGTIQDLGLKKGFLYLTGRVGFTDVFWAIEADSYSEYTQEFFSSLELKEDANDQPYIKFRLCHKTHHIPVTTLHEWFGLPTIYRLDRISFHEDLLKEQFWRKLTGMRVVENKDYKARHIPHPLFRVIQRILACTIFARGETVNRVNNEDLQLIDLMLSPDEDLRIPDLISIMIEHWLTLQSQRRGGGKVSCCAYITYIGQQLGLQFSHDDLCTRACRMDAETLRLAHFIRIERDVVGHRDMYFWKFASGSERLLSFEAPISFTDHNTWIVTETFPPPPARMQC